MSISFIGNLIGSEILWILEIFVSVWMIVLSDSKHMLSKMQRDPSILMIGYF